MWPVLSMPFRRAFVLKPFVLSTLLLIFEAVVMTSLSKDRHRSVPQICRARAVNKS